MTNARKLRTLLAILECAPAAHAITVFESAARSDNLSLFWQQYQSALRTSKRHDEPLPKSGGEITLAMPEPAMKAVYNLPTTDGARSAAVQSGHDGRNGS